MGRVTKTRSTLPLDTMKKGIIEECIRSVRSKHGPTHPCWKYKSTHYTFIITNDEVIAMGVNRPADVPVHFGYPECAMLHAEVDAYRRAKRRIGDRDFEVLNIRLTKEKNVRMSAPCQSCTNLLMALGCTKIYYTTDDEKINILNFGV